MVSMQVFSLVQYFHIKEFYFFRRCPNSNENGITVTHSQTEKIYLLDMPNSGIVPWSSISPSVIKHSSRETFLLFWTHQESLKLSALVLLLIFSNPVMKSKSLISVLTFCCQNKIESKAFLTVTCPGF